MPVFMEINWNETIISTIIGVWSLLNLMLTWSGSHPNIEVTFLFEFACSIYFDDRILSGKIVFLETDHWLKQIEMRSSNKFSSKHIVNFRPLFEQIKISEDHLISTVRSFIWKMSYCLLPKWPLFRTQNSGAYEFRYQLWTKTYAPPILAQLDTFEPFLHDSVDCNSSRPSTFYF